MANQTNSKSVRILDLIESSGGMRLKDIQEALWKMSHPDTEPFSVKMAGGSRYNDLGIYTTKPANVNRGYWCTNLLGGMHYHPGLLKFFCKRDGRFYVRNKIPHEGKPWKVMSRENP